ncbi:MAG: phosphatase PAP2 family protein [Clostridia bacterium]|nr:phosphatase PAP2 family protein [Clostridia bacterium]
MAAASKKHTVISWALFAVCFAGLLITATFTDLRVSQILTKGTLAPGKFLADGLFGVVFECIGTTAPYVVGVFCLEIVFVYVLRFMKNPAGRFTLCFLLEAGAFAAYYVLALDILNYNFRHYGLEGTPKPAFMRVELAFVAALLVVLVTFAVNSLSDESIRRLLRVAFAAFLAIAVSSLTVEYLKHPFGRTRYRAMNYAGDFSYFTRWYVLNGQPDKEWMKETFSSTDACKSFPSGHTQSAALIFCIVMLKDAFGITSKKIKALLWGLSILWTGLVALSRIMVGAHFFSDVLVGGTIGFLSVMLAREIFVCRGSHLKALSGKE